MSYDKFFEKTKQVKRGAETQFKVQKSAEDLFREQLKSKNKNKKNVKKSEFPFVPLLSLGLVVTVLGGWTLDPELPEKLFSKVHFSFQTSAVAKEETGKKTEAKTAEPKVEKAAKSATSDLGQEEPKTAENVPSAQEEMSHFQALRERKTKLDLKEKELIELEEELQKQKAEIEVRIKQLEDLRGQISTALKGRIDVDQERVMKLVETYSTMKPKQAAEILSGLDEDLAVEVLGKMKKKNVAEIMNLLEPAKARSISEKYAGYKAR